MIELILIILWLFGALFVTKYYLESQGNTFTFVISIGYLLISLLYFISMCK